MRSNPANKYPAPPCECGGKTTMKLTAKDFKINGRTIVVNNVPSYVCTKCGEVYFNVVELADIKKRLEKGPVPAYA